MKSPFAIFRKNQRLGMALLTIMAMFAFVFLGNAGGSRGGRAGGGADVVVRTNAGKIDQVMLQDMIRSRNVCNMFLQRAIVRAFSDGNQFMLQQRIQQATFGPANRQNMVLNYLLRQEAHRLGIVISDSAIEQFIDRVTEGKFSSAAFNELLAEMHWNSRELYDALRGELEANLAFRIEAPSDPQTPDQYWSFYRQLKIEASVQVAAVPVKEFLAKVPDPGDRELKEYFEANRNRWPGTPPDYQPGFKQPRRVQLQYLTASYEAVEKLVPEVTDKDVETYYEENKDTLFLETAAPKRGSETGPLEPEFTPDNPEAAPKEGDSEKPAEKPADEKPEAPSVEKPADTEKKPAEPKEDTPEAAPKDEKQPEKKAEDEPKGARTRILKSTGLLAFADDAEKAAKAQEPQPTATDAEPTEAKPAAAKTGQPEAAEKPGEAKPADKAEQPAEETGKPAAAGGKPETEVEETPAEKPKEKRYKPLTDELKEVIRERILDQRTQTALGELADQTSEAMTQLSLKYNNLATKSTRGGWELYADLNGNDQLDEGEPSVFVKQKPNLESLDPIQYRLLRAAVAKVAEADLEAAAKKLQMSFGETGLVSAMQLSELPQIGNAEELTDDAMSLRESTNILQLVFSDETPYRALRLRNPDTRNLIVAWKCQDVPARVPAYSDPGVKEDVLNTWKTHHAQPLAEKRAEELAKLANEHAGDSVSKSLHEQTVSGEKGATTVEVKSPPSFTWMRESTAGMTNPFAPKPPPQMSQIPFVERPGKQFMRLIFDELKEGQAGVAPNEDRSIYYVVKLERRNPGTKEGLAAMRETFLKTNLFMEIPGLAFLSTPYQDLAQQRQREAIFEWQRGLEKRYALEWVNAADEVGDRE